MRQERGKLVPAFAVDTLPATVLLWKRILHSLLLVEMCTVHSPILSAAAREGVRQEGRVMRRSRHTTPPFVSHMIHTC